MVIPETLGTKVSSPPLTAAKKGNGKGKKHKPKKNENNKKSSFKKLLFHYRFIMNFMKKGIVLFILFLFI
jgi:hypothetical protein